MPKDDQSAAKLVERILAGDTNAEAELVARYSRGVSRIIGANGGQREVEDLSQKTFKLALEKLRRGDLREPEKLSGFIASLAHNLTIEHFRQPKLKKETGIEAAEPAVDPAPNPLDQLLQKETEQLVAQAIKQLKSPRDRKILTRLYQTQDDHGQIRAELGLTNLQYNLALHRARARCRKLFEKLIRRSAKKPGAAG